MNSPPDKPPLSFERVTQIAESKLIRGEGLLRCAELATIVQESILFGRPEKYLLHAWCIMPNHVHIVLTPVYPNALSKILQGMKSFSSSSINRTTGRNGEFWERETFDHLIRRVDHFQGFIEYTNSNPVKAGLASSPAEYPFCTIGAGFEGDTLESWIDPRTTPFAELRSRGELPHLHKDAGSYFVTFRTRDAILPGQKAPKS